MFLSDNIVIYSFANDKYYKELKRYWKNNCDTYKGEALPYNLLVKFTKEIIKDLLRVEYLYDLRELPY